jgi:hypothetical protein
MRRTSRRTCWCWRRLNNGHYEALPEAWERQFYIIALTHCEGPDHLARLELAMKLSGAKGHRTSRASCHGRAPVQQVEACRRYHRTLWPPSPPQRGLREPLLPEEEAYIAEGDFPHQGKIEIPARTLVEAGSTRATRVAI